MPPHTIQLNDSGPDVEALQQALIEAGIAPTNEANVFGPLTLAAVKDFQGSHNLGADGIVGPRTWASLSGDSDPATGEQAIPAPDYARMSPLMQKALELADVEWHKGVKELAGNRNRGPEVDGYLVGQHADGRDLLCFTTYADAGGPVCGWCNGKTPTPQCFGAPWCFTGDVEILTERGWVAFRDYDEALAVAQVHPDDLTLSLTSVIAAIRKEHKGRLVTVKRRGLDLTMDPEHRLFGRWEFPHRRGVKKDWADREIHPVGELTGDGRASSLSIPAIAGTDRRDAEWPDRDLRLLGAFVADGFFHRDRAEFSVSREDKIEWLQALEPAHVYRAPRAYGPRTKAPLTTINFQVPPVFAVAMNEYKIIDPVFAWSLSRRQARLVLDTVTSFDGSAEGQYRRLGQSHKGRIDALHHLAVLAGYQAQTGEGRTTGEFDSEQFTLSYEQADRGRPTIIDRDQVTTSIGDAPLYCVQVPSGLIVVRPPFGRAVIVGNCARFALWAIQGAALELGIDDPTRGGGDLAGAGKWIRWAKAHDKLIGAGSLAAAQPDAGAVACISTPGHGHVMLAASFVEGGRFSTREGNASNRVNAHWRTVDSITAWVRVS